MDRHAFERLEIGDLCHRKGDGGGGDSVPRRDHRDRGHRADLGGAVELVHRAGHFDEITNGDVHAEGPVEHEDAFRRQWIAVCLRILLLQVEAAKCPGALEVTDDNRLDHDTGAVMWARRPGTLDLMDETGNRVRWHDRTNIGHADGRDELGIGVVLRAPPLPLGQR